MNLEIIILSEASQKDKDKYHMIHLYVECTILYNELTYKQKQTHRPREQTCDCQGGDRIGKDELGVWN